MTRITWLVCASLLCARVGSAQAPPGPDAGAGVQIEPESDAGTVPGTEPESDAGTVPGTETESDPGTATDPGAASEPEPATEAGAPSESPGTEPEPGAATESALGAATESAPGAATESALGPGAAPVPVPAPLPEPDPEIAAQEAAAAAAAANALALRQRVLRGRLAHSEAELADATAVVPWLVLGTGIAAAAVGTGAGIAATFSCEGADCGTPFWPGWLAVGGVAMITGGAIWVGLAGEHREALDSRRYHIKRELERLHWDHPELLQSSDRAAVRSHIRF